jgi:UDP-N-acetylglucosamine 2-epimerase (non-hydrolysing)
MSDRESPHGQKRLIAVYGTRPEAIKLAPLIPVLRSCYDVALVATGQHREMVSQVEKLFRLTPDFDLDMPRMRKGLFSTLTETTARVADLVDKVQPSGLLVQGDTNSALGAALAAFYAQIPVFHVEAGLRSDNVRSPFPEEGNRRLISHISALHFAPTVNNRNNLLREHIAPESIFVTGNTVIDALLSVASADRPYEDNTLGSIDPVKPVVLFTSHRRENLGQVMRGYGNALARLAGRHPHVTFLVPVHKNPAVRESLLPPIRHFDNVVITEPLTYGDLTKVMNTALLVVTDSGGLQEEAPALGKPVLVIRDTTERPEGLEAGTVRLIGTSEDSMVAETSRLLTDAQLRHRMSTAVNPYGDGHASRRIARAIACFFGEGERPDEYTMADSAQTP